MRTLWEIFFVALKLGCTSFGGPIAHLGYFQQEYIQKRKWLTNDTYSQLVALSQFLPGPASSQVGMGIGLLRGGILGGIVSFLGFTLPSALLLMFFAYFYTHTTLDMGWTQGLKLVAVAIVAQAIVDMSKKLLTNSYHIAIAIGVLILMLVWVHPLAQITAISMAAIVGYYWFRGNSQSVNVYTINLPMTKKVGMGCLLLFVLLLVSLPIAATYINNEWLILAEKFYMAGAFVFGGGHVVLPLLEAQFVHSGLLSSADFLAGYGVTQAVPGPLFTFAAYIGMTVAGVFGATVAIVAIFLPAFLLVVGVLPFWFTYGQHAKLRGAMMGANAAVVGILTAAFVQPIVIDTIHSALDGVLACIFFLCLLRWKVQPYLLVAIGIVVGLLFY
ncbi:chromate efflux transporter [Lysinibacillus piscis]|uniref:Chromate efflux transporter n=1 Tax=Lysinibacillus piscis TaxID=2518931 RepID=A0ABQ5NKE3_9BACI|nr:chromate efflux transporter [Lysinibacillus sp. KH24]GLC88551.1 hypothetical protein LYSBPC_16780 [Lysinibacillus sp. KH24]